MSKKDVSVVTWDQITGLIFLALGSAGIAFIMWAATWGDIRNYIEQFAVFGFIIYLLLAGTFIMTSFIYLDA